MTSVQELYFLFAFLFFVFNFLGLSIKGWYLCQIVLVLVLTMCHMIWGGIAETWGGDEAQEKMQFGSHVYDNGIRLIVIIDSNKTKYTSYSIQHTTHKNIKYKIYTCCKTKHCTLPAGCRRHCDHGSECLRRKDTNMNIWMRCEHVHQHKHRH